jgi:hypothetical protein
VVFEQCGIAATLIYTLTCPNVIEEKKTFLGNLVYSNKYRDLWLICILLLVSTGGLLIYKNKNMACKLENGFSM